MKRDTYEQSNLHCVTWLFISVLFKVAAHRSICTFSSVEQVSIRTLHDSLVMYSSIQVHTSILKLMHSIFFRRPFLIEFTYILSLSKIVYNP